MKNLVQDLNSGHRVYYRRWYTLHHERVCVYIYIYIYMCVCVYIYIYIYTHVRGVMYIYIYIYIYMSVCVYVWEKRFYTDIHILHTYKSEKNGIYTNMNTHVRGAFNKFPDLFVEALKIVVDTWKFTMSLLYILWDDWPIFMNSGSNEQLQQELEYTLVKPDCHRWWISLWTWGQFRRAICNKIQF